MSLKPSHVDQMWTKRRFEVTEKSDHVRAVLRHEGKAIVMTKRSHGAKGVAGNIPQFIRQQMKLSSGQFSDAVQCPLDRDGYIQILKDKGLI